MNIYFVENLQTHSIRLTTEHMKFEVWDFLIWLSNETSEVDFKSRNEEKKNLLL